MKSSVNSLKTASKVSANSRVEIFIGNALKGAVRNVALDLRFRV